MKISFFVYVCVFITSMPLANFSVIIQVFSGWQIFVQSAVVASMVSHYDHLNVFSSAKINFTLMLFYLSVLLRLLNIHYQVYFLFLLNSLLLYLFFSSVLILAMYWIMVIIYRSVYAKRIVKYDDYICLAFIVMAIVSVPAWISLDNITPASRSSTYLAGDLLIRFLVIYFTSSFTKRLVKHQAQINKLEAEFKTELVKYLSHEIRNPLNILAMSLEHVKLEVEKGNFSKEFIAESISALESGCCGALEVLNELVTYEEIEAGYFKLTKTQCNPFLLLQESLQSLVEVIIPFGLHLHISVPPEDRQHLRFLLTDADKEEIGVVLRKVISKCIYEYKNGDTIDVVLSVLKAPVSIPSKSSTQVAPSDSSIGAFRIRVPFPTIRSDFDTKYISDDDLHFRREGTGDNERLGLNIWLSRKIITLHGGDMGLITDDTGSSIFIDLPCRISHEEIHEVQIQSKVDEPVYIVESSTHSQAGALSLTAPVSTACKFSNEKMHLLVVDDSSLNRKVIVKVMTSLGHTCDTAEDGSVAVELLKTTPFESYDAILME